MKGSMYPTGFFACKDGFVCIASQTPKQWEAFLALMDNPKWSKEGQAGNCRLPGPRRLQARRQALPTWLMEYTREELLEMAMAENIVMGVAQRVDEVLASEQFAFRELFWSELGGRGSTRAPEAGLPADRDADGPRRRAVPPSTPTAMRCARSSRTG